MFIRSLYEKIICSPILYTALLTIGFVFLYNLTFRFFVESPQHDPLVTSLAAAVFMALIFYPSCRREAEIHSETREGRKKDFDALIRRTQVPKTVSEKKEFVHYLEFIIKQHEKLARARGGERWMVIARYVFMAVLLGVSIVLSPTIIVIILMISVICLMVASEVYSWRRLMRLKKLLSLAERI